MPNKQKCALCAVEYAPTELSHIVPKFVYRWLKATSATKFMRFGPKMNQRAQDGIKDYFLCEACEDSFEKHESKFASDIFTPFVQDNCHTADYGEYMLKFAVSVSWRVLAYAQENGLLHHFQGRHAVAVTDTLAIWRDYLLNKTHEIGNHEIHLLPMSGVIDHSSAGVPENINRYLRRAIEINVGVANTGAFTYCKLGPMIFIGLIHYPELAHWQKTKINKSGQFPPMNFTAPAQFMDFIFMRSRRLAELESQLSERQLENIKISYEKNIDCFEQSDTYKTLLMDLKLKQKSKA